MSSGSSVAQRGGGGDGGQESSELVELKLPSKIGRGNIVQSMAQQKVLINGFEVSLKEAIPQVYKHEIKFQGTNKKGVEKDLSKGPRNDVSNILRHEALYDMYQVMLRSYEDTFGNTKGEGIYRYAYDCGINFYSQSKLMNIKEELTFVIDKSKLKENTIDFLSKANESIKAVILATEVIDLRSTSAVAEELELRDKSVEQFLNILSNQVIYNNGTYFIYAQKMFAKDERNSIRIQDDPRIIKSGMAKGVRFIGDDLKSATPLFQVDPKKTLFFNRMSLLEYISHISRTQIDKLENRVQTDGFRRQLIKELKDLQVRTKHMEKNIFFNIVDVSKDGASSIMLDMQDGRKSVADYYNERYHLRLRYPNLPCVIERRVRKVDGQNRPTDNNYPMEILEIVEGQRVPLNKMTPKLTEQMIRNCLAKPAQFQQEIEQQRSNAMLQSGAPNFKAFGIRIDTNIKQAVSEVLFPPAIGYANSQIIQLPGQDRDGGNDVAWQIKGTRFWRPATPPKIWVAALFQQGIPGNDLIAFLNGLRENAGRIGLQLPKEASQEMLASTEIEFVRSKIEYYKKNNATFVLFFTRDKLDPVHHTMKLMEVEFKILTQHICKQTVDKANSGKGSFLVYNNILQKMNLKLGGVNWDLISSQAFMVKNRTQENVFKNTWLKQARMFIGLDLSHPGPQSFYERRAGIPQSSPTIVGMAVTVGHPVCYRGTYWCQKPRETIIDRLADKVVEALKNYASYNGDNYPNSIVVFRGGVPEGDYAKVMTKEVQFFKNAFETIKKEKPDFREPILTIIVVQKTSNYRTVPVNIDPRAPPPKQNVPPGTVIHSGVMHPSQMQFLLVPHKAIQGTAHPIVCTVVFDNAEKLGQNRMNLEEVENVCNSLCYAHGIVSSPVSVPAPLYSAADLAKRGRNNWKIHTFGSDTESNISGDSGGKSGKNVEELGYWVDLSENLKPGINTKFWA